MMAFILCYLMIFVLLRSFVKDETFLTVAECSCSIVVFISGIIYNDKTHQRELLNDKKQYYTDLTEVLSLVQENLNIKNKQLSLLHSFSPELDFNSAIKDIAEVVENIETATYKYNAFAPRIKNSKEKEDFESCLITLSTSFITVLQLHQESFSKWGDVIVRANHAKSSAELIGTKTNKLDFVILSNQQIIQMENEKQKLLNTCNRQLPQLNKLISNLNQSIQNLLDLEYSDIVNLESRI